MMRLALAAAAIATALIVTAIAIWHLGEALLLALESGGFGPAGATLIVGLVGLLLAALIAFAARLAACPRRAAHSPSPPSGVNDLANQLGGILADRVVSATRAHPYGTVGAALLAGLVAGAVPELRTLLNGVLKE